MKVSSTEDKDTTQCLWWLSEQRSLDLKSNTLPLRSSFNYFIEQLQDLFCMCEQGVDSYIVTPDVIMPFITLLKFYKSLKRFAHASEPTTMGLFSVYKTKG